MAAMSPKNSKCDCPADQTYAIARHALGDRGLVDLVGVLGYYSMISMTIKMFNV